MRCASRPTSTRSTSRHPYRLSSRGCGRSRHRRNLVLTGTQAIDDLRGLSAPWIAHLLGRPYVGIVTSVARAAAANHLLVLKEFPGSVRAEIDVPLPAVLGVQAAEKPPRYVPVARVRSATKTQRIEAVPAAPPPRSAALEMMAMAKPPSAGHAEMIEGDVENAAGRLVDILEARGLV